METTKTKLKNEPRRVFTSEDFKRWGQKGGKSTLRKYGKKQAREWGKLGGNPKKFAKVDN